MFIESEETVRVNGPTGVGGLRFDHVDGSQRVKGKSGENIMMEVLHVEEGASLEHWRCEIYCPQRYSKLFLYKYWLQIVRVDTKV